MLPHTARNLKRVVDERLLMAIPVLETDIQATLRAGISYSYGGDQMVLTPATENKFKTRCCIHARQLNESAYEDVLTRVTTGIKDVVRNKGVRRYGGLVVKLEPSDTDRDHWFLDTEFWA